MKLTSPNYGPRTWILMWLVCSKVAFGMEIGFLFALDADLQALKKELGEPVRVIAAGDRRIQVIPARGHRIYALKMESGVTESAVSCTALLSRNRCDVIVTSGVVGGLTEVPTATTPWLRVESVLGYQRGTWSAGQLQTKEALVAEPPKNSILEAALPSRWKSAVPIKVASGEVFVTDSAQRSELRSRGDCQVVDMNLLGLLTAQKAFEVPGLHFRLISDRADESAGEDFRRFVADYDGEGGRLLAELVRSLPDDKSKPESYEGLRRLLNPGLEPDSAESSAPDGKEQTDGKPR
jgi:nucleoside phosphorylase